ncbi:retrovirus-related pol polyprotein from transposon TNT 1-94 [Tanacetum coccineum]
MILKINIKSKGGLLRLKAFLKLLLLRSIRVGTTKSFEALQKHAINLELALQQCKEQIKNDKAFKENQSNVFLKEREQYFEIQDFKAQLQDKGIAKSELKKLIEKMKRKYAETKFEKSSVIRQPNAFKSQRQSILGKPTTFSDSLAKTDFSKSKSVTTNNVSNDFSKPVTAQILPQNVKLILKNTNVIAPGMYKVHTKPNQTRTPQLPQDIRKTNKRVSFSTRVIPTTSVSIPQLKSNQLEDRVMPNNSQGKKQEVEDHHRNFKTKMPMVVPISTREPTRTVNQSAATPLKRTVAAESTNQKPRSTIRKQYEQISKTCKWWYCKFTPSRYKWKPKFPIGNVNTNLVEIILVIVDSGCSKHLTGNLKLLSNFMEKFMGMVKFGNDQIASIIGYGDLVQGNITIKRVYYVKGLNHNLFSVGQLCDADLEVSFRKSTSYIRDLKGNDLLIGSRGIDLYSVTLQDTSTPNHICLMAKATSSQAWLWHRHLSHLNFNSINLMSKNDIVIGLPKFKFVKDHLYSSCELGKAKRKLVQRGLHAQVRTMRTDRGTEFLNKTLHAYFAQEAIATTCFTQNRSLVIPRREKTPYHIINGWKSSVKFFHIFGSLCYIVRDGENLDKMKEKDQVSSDPIPQCPTTALEQDSLSLGPQSQENVTQAAEIVTTSNELDLLFSLLFDELLNGTTPVASKSFAVTATDAPNKRQQQHITPSTSTTIVVDIPPLNIQTTPKTTSQAPT